MGLIDFSLFSSSGLWIAGRQTEPIFFTPRKFAPFVRFWASGAADFVEKMRWERAELGKEAVDGGGCGGPGKRWGHTCNAIKGGRFLYVFGGYGQDNCQTNLVHVFDSGGVLSSTGLRSCCCLSSIYSSHFCLMKWAWCSDAPKISVRSPEESLILSVLMFFHFPFWKISVLMFAFWSSVMVYSLTDTLVSMEPSYDR